MPTRYTLGSFTNTIMSTLGNAWERAKNYLTVENPAPEHRQPYHSPNVKKLIVMGAMRLLANKNPLGLGLGLATTALFAEPANAALPTVANPIPIQYAEAGRNFSYDIDLNHVFNDADGDIMTFGGVTMTDGSPLLNWLTAGPILLANYDTPGLNRGLAVVGNIIYLADGALGLQLINVTNSSAPVLMGNYLTSSGAMDVVVINEVAYVANDNLGMQIINVSVPNASMALGSYATPGKAYGVAVQNSVAYIADDTSGLQFINITNPNNPRLLGTYNTPGSARNVVVTGNVAYVADFLSGLQIIDVTSASNPILLGNFSAPSAFYGLTAVGQMVYAADDVHGLLILNVTDANAPSLLGSYNTPDSARGVAVKGNVAYVADGYSGLLLINVTNPRVPTLLGSCDTRGHSRRVVVKSPIAYVADYDFGLQMIDIGKTRLTGMVPSAAIGSYGLTMHATNDRGEWIATDFELNIVAPSTAPTAMASSFAPLPKPAPAPIPGPSATISGIPASVPMLSPQTMSAIVFQVITAAPIPIEIGVSTLITGAYLSITGNANPSQVIYTVQVNSDWVFTLNGVETNQFTQADVDNHFVAVEIKAPCEPSPPVLEAQLGDVSSLITLTMDGSFSSCGTNGASYDKAITTENIALLLTTVGIGFWAKGREKRQSECRAQTNDGDTVVQTKKYS